MANLGNNVKTAFLKGLEALGKTASSLSDAAQQKLSEMNLETRRREMMAEIPRLVMQLWKDGVELPPALSELLGELSELDEKLSAMRPQPEEKAEEDQTEEAEEEAGAADEEAEQEPLSCEENACEAPDCKCECECTGEDCGCEDPTEPESGANQEN